MTKSVLFEVLPESTRSPSKPIAQSKVLLPRGNWISPPFSCYMPCLQTPSQEVMKTIQTPHMLTQCAAKWPGSAMPLISFYQQNKLFSAYVQSCGVTAGEWLLILHITLSFKILEPLPLVFKWLCTFQFQSCHWPVALPHWDFWYTCNCIFTHSYTYFLSHLPPLPTFIFPIVTSLT